MNAPLAGALGFPDVPPNEWYAPYVNEAQSLGIVSGYVSASGAPTGLFGPANEVTLAQVAKMAVETAGYEAEAYPKTEQPSHWASSYFGVLSVVGGSSIYFPPSEWDRPATRGEVASIISKVYEDYHRYTDVMRCQYDDVRPDHQYYTEISTLTRLNIMVGDGRSTYDFESGDILKPCVSTTFRPDDTVKRGEAAKIMVTVHKLGMPGVAATQMYKTHTPTASAACKIWAGSFGWYDPEEEGGTGILSPEAYSRSCNGWLSTEPDIAKVDSLQALCTEVKKPDADAHLQAAFCSSDHCAAMTKIYCEQVGSDQVGYTQQYLSLLGCAWSISASTCCTVAPGSRGCGQ